MNFSEALIFIKHGGSVFRRGWNGNGLSVKIQFPDEKSKMNLPYLYIEYADGRRCPWHASQTDILENDWEKV